MSSLTQFFGGGGVGTVYTFNGNFTHPGQGGIITHAHNLNLPQGYNISAWAGTLNNTPFTNYFNINGNTVGESSDFYLKSIAIRRIAWLTNSCEISTSYGAGQNATANGSIEILY